MNSKRSKKSNKSKNNWIVFGVVILVILIVGIFWVKSSLISRKFTSTPSDTIREKAPKEVALSEELVPGFPDLPLYPASSLTGSRSHTGEEGVSYFAEYRIQGLIVDVFDWYLEKLPASGWEISHQTKPQGELKSFVIVANKDIYKLTVDGEKLAESQLAITFAYEEIE